MLRPRTVQTQANTQTAVPVVHDCKSSQVSSSNRLAESKPFDALLTAVSQQLQAEGLFIFLIQILILLTL